MNEVEVLVIKSDTGECVKRIPCSTPKVAERVERSLNINLNHEEYHTEID